ncbi:MAG TPA: hypothetical protein PLK58_02290 [Candidatus Rifleibacterium sp.]|nr:hypothetical protein [Candidatus Rifleibacterium sp.]
MLKIIYNSVGARLLAAAFLCVFALATTGRIAMAFSDKELMVTNICIPAALAGLRAHYNGTDIKKAMIQAAFGGLLMREGFKIAPRLEEKPAWQAWKAKILVNLGASLAESAGDDFVYRMDIGPVWLIVKDRNISFKPALNAVIAPVVHLIEGSKPDWGRSLKYGTFAFERSSSRDGTLNGTGALAYSNANTFTTNKSGSHSGHELVHTFQYRRDAMSPLRLGNLISGLDERLGDNWVDDTGWGISWGLQCGWADLYDKSKDFDIPLEKEAYYLEKKYRRYF